MSVTTRIIRLWKADFNGLMDEIEDKSLLLKQHIREMEEELEKKKQIIDEMELEAEQLIHENNQYCFEQKEFEKDLEIAILKEKDDIARMLIKKIGVINRHIKNLKLHRLDLEQKKQKLQEKMIEQQTQYNQLKLRTKKYLIKKEQRRNTSMQNDHAFYATDTEYEPSNEEIELELFKYKEMFQTTKKGEQP